MQIFHAQTLSILFGQRVIFFIFYKHLLALDDDAERRVLQRLLSLYGANIALKQIGLLYEVIIETLEKNISEKITTKN